MPGTGTEVFDGFLDVKVPADVRKRGLAPWKAWRRQWCAVRREIHEGAPLEVQIGFGADQKIQVSSSVAVWRTQSRSRVFAFGVFCGDSGDQRPVLFLAGRNEAETQRWMHRVRHMTRRRGLGVGVGVADTNKTPAQSGVPTYHVSLIDNEFTQAARLTGTFGNLKVTAQDVTIIDPYSGEVKAKWPWGHLQQFQLVANGVPEDRDKICLIRTSRAFSGGAGNIYLYCERAPDLLQSLLTGGHCPIEPLSPPLPLRNMRRLSRSENDIRSALDQSRTLKTSSLHMVGRKIGMLTRTPDMRKRLSSISGRGKNKSATHLITASLGLMLKPPPREGIDDNEDFDDFQQVFSSCEDLVGEMIQIPALHAQRRESAISVISNIYEEIHDLSKPEEIFVLETEAIYANVDAMTPPPLPPRRHCTLPVRSATFGSMRSMFHKSAAQALCDRDEYVEPDSVQGEPDYMPMAPGLGLRWIDKPKQTEQTTEEQHYVVMSNLDKAM